MEEGAKVTPLRSSFEVVLAAIDLDTNLRPEELVEGPV
jgi:hypothetical protein